MSALAIDPNPPRDVREAKPREKAGDFKGTLKTAQKKPAAQQQAKKPVDDAAPDDEVAPQAIALAQQQAAAAKPVADDVVSLISAGKSLVGTSVDAAVAALDPADQPAALEPVKTLAHASDALPMTPLEQAVHDVLERLQDDSGKGESSHDDPEPQPQLPGVTAIELHVEDDHPSAPVEAVREAPEAPQPANPSHVHLVIDDGERLVVTVAVRGDQVITHVRGDNADTAAALARNAGVLDDAMRARGLKLGEFQATHDQSERGQPRPHHDRREPEKAQPRFSIEENL